MPRRQSSIAVRHNIEVAHRLFLLPGKCEQIHGHSMDVTLDLDGELNAGGILGGIEYGDLKRMFRGYLDEQYDHRLLLNVEDPFAGDLITVHRDASGQFTEKDDEVTLPGLNVCPGDPTTENIAWWILQGMESAFETANLSSEISSLFVEVWETKVNRASAYVDYTDNTETGISNEEA